MPKKSVLEQLALGRDRATVEQDEWDRQQRRKNLETQGVFVDRYDFLNDCDAIPATPELYATWLAAYVGHGGQVTSYSRHDLSRNGDRAYPFFNYWVPRQTFVEIPTGFGAGSMDLLTFPDFVEGNYAPTSKDPREGWEYGHSSVMRLELDRAEGGLALKASTNNPNSVVSYPDVERVIVRNPDICQRVGAQILSLLESGGDMLDMTKFLRQPIQ